MEQHPIPQDVTGFQFKLIGTMTVKQFGYVSLGAIFAVIAWYAPLEGLLWQIIAKGILLPIFGVSGVIVAFVPIEGRPVDVMTMNFIHALFSPNQYVFIKKGRKFSFTQVSYTKVNPQSSTMQKPANQAGIENKKEQQLRALLSGSYKNAKNALDQKEIAFLQSVTPATIPIAVPQIKTGMQIKPPPKPLQPFLPATPPLKPSLPHTQAIPVKIETTQIRPQPNPPPAQNTIHSFSHIPDTPNIITGIVKDPRGNIIPNIIVEIKDKDGTPVRAFKTNPLGQFASATPLADGNYKLELEDPKKHHAFNIIPISAKGQIMLPIEIISHDAREELRKALFN